MRKQTSVVVWLTLIAVLTAGTSFARSLPYVDAFGAKKPVPSNDSSLSNRAQRFIKPGTRVLGESRLGVPTFVWAGLNTQVPANLTAKQLPNGGAERVEEVAARAHLSNYASLYNLDATDVSAAQLVWVHNTGKGAVIVRLEQQVKGIEVFREQMNVVMDRKLNLVAITGYITSTTTPAARGQLSFVLDGKNAIASAVTDLTSTGFSASALQSTGTRDGYDFYSVTASDPSVTYEPIRTKKVYFHLPEGLEPAYYLEVISTKNRNQNEIAIADDDDTDAYGYVISAVDGRVLFRNNLIANEQDGARVPTRKTSNSGQSYTYRVWADPVTKMPYDGPMGNLDTPKVNPVPDGFQPSYVPTVDISLASGPISTGDPWLPDNSTETVGNNVDAFLNLITPDGYGPVAAPADPATGDFRAQITSTNSFLHTYDPTQQPTLAEQRQAAAQQLFYDNNYLHDWYYDAGFDEASGNAQTSNYGRGGAENDNIKAQGQDFSARNNANMLTPADGSRPRMRMYVFDANVSKFLNVTAPAGIAGFRTIGTGTFGPQTFNLTGNIAYATPNNGCTALTNAAAMNGNIGLVQYDTACSIGTKITNLQNAGVSSIVLVYLQSSPDSVVNVTGTNSAFVVPFTSISWNGAAGIKTQLAASQTVTATLRRDSGIDRDGTIDNQVIAHEWFHYVSNRLIGNGSGLGSQQSAGMGEGWSDTDSMAISVRPDDTSVASNATFNGVYAMAAYVTGGQNFNGSGGNDGAYFGIRRYPYSTDMTKNPLTFIDISDGQALPVGPPVAFGANGATNSEVHNTGEVWAEMLWECYAAMLRDTLGSSPRLSFQDAQDRWRRYLIASLKITPTNPTLVEARDGVLAAAYANDYTDYVEFNQAFAKRGIGMGAIAPDRFSTNNVGVTESYISGGALVYKSATLDDSNGSCDNDGVLDASESGKLSITLSNVGDQVLTGTTATVTSTNPSVSFTNGGVISFPTSEPYGTTTGSIGVTITGAVGIQSVPVNISYNDPGLAIAGPLTATAVLAANYNVIPAASATDTVESNHVVWTTSGNITLSMAAPFVRQQDTASINHFWFGPDPNAGSDQYLTSPVFTVDGSGSMNLQFDHSWGFEFDGGGNYDGGVVEFSVNGGAWSDLGGPAYNGTILNYSGDVNPLKGRTAFVANSSGTVHTSLTQAIAPGSTVQIRFRAASDSSGSAAGWQIDNIAFTGVVETPFDVVVADAGCYVNTQTVVTSSSNPAPLGGPLTLTATVTATRSGVNGTVSFFDGSNFLGNGTLVNGVATFTTSALSFGSHSITANFNGSAGYGASNSPAYTQVISKAATTTALSSSSNPSIINSSVTFTATVTATSGMATGSVTFLDGSTTLASIALNGSGVATYTTSSLSAGSHSITAAYGTTASFAGSTSSVVNQVVNLNAVTIQLASSANPSVTGQQVTFTATVSAGATGSVTFKDGINDLQTVSLSGTTATYSTSSLSVATHPITATYSGDSTHSGVTSDTLQQEVDNVAGMAFAAAKFNVYESAGNAVVTVIRNGDVSSTASVQYATTAGTATAPADFTQTSGTLNFGAGEASKTFSVPVADDTLLEGNETFTVTLSNPVGTTIGAGATATVTIVDNDVTGGDFDRNGSTDIIIKDSSGQFTTWYLNGGAISSTATLRAGTDPNWQIIGTGDAYGTGQSDIYWRNTSTGETRLFVVNGSVITSDLPIHSGANLGWNVVGIADFNGDGKADILWRETSSGQTILWTMSGNQITSSDYVHPGGNQTWTIAGVGDIDGDGKADVLWRENSSGQTLAWLMNGSSIAGAIFIHSGGNQGWTIQGLADFNADHHADILWRETSSGQTVLWTMGAAGMTNSTQVHPGGNQGWTIAGMGDLNNDHKADVLWRETSTGHTLAWLMDGFSINGSYDISNGNASSTIVSPSH